MTPALVERGRAFLLRRGTRDVAWSLAGSGGTMLVGVATTMLLARFLGPGGFGVLSVALAVAFTIAGLADWGFSLAFVRLASPEVMAGRPIRHLHTAFLALRLACAGLVALAILVASARLFPAIHLPTDLPWLGPVAALAGLALAASGHYAAVLQVLRLQRALAVVRLAAAALRFGAYTTWALLATRHLEVALVIALTAIAAEALLTGWRAHRAAELWPPVTRRPPAAWMAFSFWAAVPAIAYGLIGQTDTVLLAVLAGPEETGIWAAVSRISGVLILVAGAAWSVALPYVTALPDIAAVRRYARLAGYWCLATIVGAAVVALLAPFIVRVLYGDAYTGGTTTLRLLLAGHTVGSVTLLMAPVAYRFGRERLMAVTGLVQFAVNFAGDVALIPRAGAAGCAAATLAMYLVTAAVLAPRVARDLASGALPPAAPGRD